MGEMGNWDNFYMLSGGTAGTLIGLIFVVITLGMEHGKPGDQDRTRIFVTPILVQFGTVLVVALASMAPLSTMTRAIALALIGCAGLAYVANLAALARRRTELEERELLWDALLPIAAYIFLAIGAAAWALSASFADEFTAIAAVFLLIIGVRNSWAITLAIGARRK